MSTFDERPEFSEDELRSEFAALFPNGWAGPDVLAELAPDGWADSPLVRVFHPTAEQVHEEQLRMHRNMANFPGRKPDAPPLPPPQTLEQVRAEYGDEPPAVEPERECQELVGQCLWDVFSDNHEVIADDGRWLRLGSARGSGGFLAEVLNAQGGPPPPPKPELPPELTAMLFPKSDDPRVQAALDEMRKEMIGDGGYTYLDFYMGTTSVSGRADLTPVYEMIFRRLRARGHEWKYHFPRLGLVDFRPLKKQLDEQARREAGEPEFAGYDPEAAMAEEEADRQRDEEIAAMQEALDAGHREAVEAARNADPPATVRAYATVYGNLPDGWPPEA
jgi:hypothetical protein